MLLSPQLPVSSPTRQANHQPPAVDFSAVSISQPLRLLPCRHLRNPPRHQRLRNSVVCLTRVLHRLARLPPALHRRLQLRPPPREPQPQLPHRQHPHCSEPNPPPPQQLAQPAAFLEELRRPLPQVPRRLLLAAAFSETNHQAQLRPLLLQLLVPRLAVARLLRSRHRRFLEEHQLPALPSLHRLVQHQPPLPRPQLPAACLELLSLLRIVQALTSRRWLELPKPQPRPRELQLRAPLPQAQARWGLLRLGLHLRSPD